MTEQTDKRIFGLDLFRAIAIICVVLTHGGFLIDKALPGFPWFSVPDGVELFFVLSGFLIGGMLIRLLEEHKLETKKDLIYFWKRRWFRTLPAYYLVLLLNLLFAYIGWNNSKPEAFDWKFLVFSHNLFEPFTDFFWESWSLSVEEWFYLILPIMIVSVQFGLRAYVSAKNLMFSIILTLLILPLIYRMSLSNVTLDNFWYEVTFRKTVICRMDAIIYGVLMAWMMNYYGAVVNKFRWILFLAGAAIMYYSKEYWLTNTTGYYAMTWYFSLMGLGASLLIPLANSWKKFDNSIGRAITHISLISYSMYLINLGLIGQVMATHYKIENETDSILGYLAFWTILIIGSTCLYKYFEKPMTDLRDKL
ncbi:MAG: acyltransferase family protein [Bacteroidota bacterium]|jgi:peptidoglycan/LPS O-acetylase OafA/YrhL